MHYGADAPEPSAQRTQALLFFFANALAGEKIRVPASPLVPYHNGTTAYKLELA